MASLHKEGPGTKSLDELKRLISKSTSSIQLVKEQLLLSPALDRHYQKRKRRHSLAYDDLFDLKERPATEDQRAIPRIKWEKARPGDALTSCPLYPGNHAGRVVEHPAVRLLERHYITS